MNLFAVIIGAVLVNNFVMVKFLGICPFLGVSKKLETAAGMGIAVTFVMTLASAVTFLTYYYILVPLRLEYLYTIMFILIIAALVQFVEMLVRKHSPVLYRALGIYLPLITTNCAVLGVVVLNKNNIDAMRDAGMRAGIIYAVVNGLASALGFLLMIVIMAGIRERQERCNIPKPFKGFPIALITAGIMSLAFLGFAGFMRG
ncbi:MAG: electron transport complex subunit RsxA [Defluviitaleaceae bacterium]|nr:electron transport complex subunit RsxA [Defluviitaleaceae bacterium]